MSFCPRSINGRCSHDVIEKIIYLLENDFEYFDLANYKVGTEMGDSFVIRCEKGPEKGRANRISSYKNFLINPRPPKIPESIRSAGHGTD